METVLILTEESWHKISVYEGNKIIELPGIVLLVMYHDTVKTLHFLSSNRKHKPEVNEANLIIQDNIFSGPMYQCTMLQNQSKCCFWKLKYKGCVAINKICFFVFFRHWAFSSPLIIKLLSYIYKVQDLEFLLLHLLRVRVHLAITIGFSHSNGLDSVLVLSLLVSEPSFLKWKSKEGKNNSSRTYDEDSSNVLNWDSSCNVLILLATKLKFTQ